MAGLVDSTIGHDHALGTPVVQAQQHVPSFASQYGLSTKYSGLGLPQRRTCNLITYNSQPDGLQYERIDPSFHVRDRSFFFEGRVFAIIMNDNAGSRAEPTYYDYDYNRSINQVEYEEILCTQA